MSEDIAYDLRRCAQVNLSSGMAVSQHVGPEDRLGDSSSSRMLAHDVPDRGPRERAMRQSGHHKNLTRN
jgi:hypothetical protein